MDVGLVLMSYHGSWDDAAYAEEHGFAGVGFVDSPLIAGDPFVAMALTAERTSTLRIGTMLAVPSNRIAPTCAAAVATVNRLAPGRAFLALGTGNTGRAVLGLKALPVGRFEEYVSSCRALLDGKETSNREGDTTRFIRMRHTPEDRYIDRDGIPIYIAADGPRARRVAWELGSGWIMSLQGCNAMMNAPEVLGKSLAAGRKATAELGRDPDDFYTMCALGLCVLEQGESATSARVLERVGPFAMLPFHAYADNPAIGEHLPAPIRDRLELYERKVLARLDVPRDRLYQETHRGHLSHLLPGEEEVLTEEIIRMTTLTGTANEIADVLRGLEAAGLRNVTLHPPAHLVREAVREYAEKIAPLLGTGSPS
ncbi:LLM class flavin-dependent oxidoreductase [Streptomyces phyllanthi]|uniref:LLM class flavin-dependent oxidoreductase n=1 Tax=Streptomyces phyllanthi TaxID=1803180 RepID=UPI0018844982|nr:LLM class flavin-dependent oxidoreductase [Streptomyces phyllanthi]